MPAVITEDDAHRLFASRMQHSVQRLLVLLLAVIMLWYAMDVSINVASILLFAFITLAQRIRHFRQRCHQVDVALPPAVAAAVRTPEANWWPLFLLMIIWASSSMVQLATLKDRLAAAAVAAGPTSVTEHGVPTAVLITDQGRFSAFVNIYERTLTFAFRTPLFAAFEPASASWLARTGCAVLTIILLAIVCFLLSSRSTGFIDAAWRREIVCRGLRAPHAEGTLDDHDDLSVKMEKKKEPALSAQPQGDADGGAVAESNVPQRVPARGVEKLADGSKFHEGECRDSQTVVDNAFGVDTADVVQSVEGRARWLPSPPRVRRAATWLWNTVFTGWSIKPLVWVPATPSTTFSL